MTALPGIIVPPPASREIGRELAWVFAQAVGWVPANVSVAVLVNKTAEKLEYFGNDKGDHFAFCVDTGVPIETRYLGVKEDHRAAIGRLLGDRSGQLRRRGREEDWKVVTLTPSKSPW